MENRKTTRWNTVLVVPVAAIAVLAVLALTASPLAAQGNPTGRISGQVSDANGDPLPGVTVTFESPALQGTQVTVTEDGGYYTSPPIPPGEYLVTYELEGFQPTARRVRASAGSDTPGIDASLEQVTVAEEIVVTGEAMETVSTDTAASQTITYDTLEELPVARTLAAAVALAPGVTDGVNGASISGAQSWDNLYTLNGVVLNENIRGQAFTLFIEDAIQETTTTVGGVSAEFGRFTGGVVTAVTKSGGNEFSGSFRLNMENEDWLGSNDLSPDREDDILNTYEATLGGFLLRDRLWFFGAGRDESTTTQETTAVLNQQFPSDFEQERYEGKLTASITSSHQLQGSYIKIDEITTNIPHGFAVDAIVIDDGSLDPAREDPQELRTLSYTGILTNNFFVEANYGEREFTFVGGGGSEREFRDSPVFDLALNVIYNESIFCGVCANEERNNEQGRAKGTWFLSTEAAGAHDLGFGYETFTDIRKADNHQSANDWMIWNFIPSITTGNEVFPVFAPGGTFAVFLPILNPSQGTDFETQSVFVNDAWRLNDAWSFNLGVRYDATDAVNSNGAKVADDSAVSPRLGASFRPGGDSPWAFHAYAGRYVGAAANGVFDNSSPAGNPAYFYFAYVGEGINTGGGPLLGPEDAVQAVFDNIFGICPDAAIRGPAPPPSLDPVFNCPVMVFPGIPGFNLQIADDLSPVSADELKVGFSRPLGSAGLVRADVIWREWNDFFITRRDLGTGTVVQPDTGAEADLGIQINSDVMTRDYLGVTVGWNAAFFDRRLRLGGGVTLSELEGNAAGETTGSGPVSTGLLEYPEYKVASWNAPEGRLPTDETINAGIYGIYDLFSFDHHRLSASLIQSFTSGQPYAADTTLDTRPFVDNPGYANPPTSTTYFFSSRDRFELDDITRTDVSLNYALIFGEWELFVQPELLNALNEDGVIDVNETVITFEDDPSLVEFNPFTETPVEGVNWRLGDSFGQPLNEDDLQRPREFRVSVGIRFNR